MEKKKSYLLHKVLAALLIGTTLVSGGGLLWEGVQVQEYETKAEKGYCTILVYMDGSDLESSYGAATEDLKEMEKALQTADISSQDVHIVVEAGGAQKWEYSAMQDESYGRFCVTAEGACDVESMEPRDMGEKDTLTDFINYGIQSYPAEYYGLIFWNHGAGQITGFGCDSQFGGSSLALDEIGDAMECSAMKNKFSFVSLDACLMGNIELAAMLNSQAEYLIASEELEPQYGYDYTWFSAIGEEMEKSPGDIGRKLGEAMLRRYESYYQDSDYKLTLSLIDLREYEGFHACFHSIMEKMLQNAEDIFYQKLGKQRKEIQGFGYSNNSTAEIVDVMDLMKAAATISGEDSAYQSLQEQYERLVVDKFTKGYAVEPSGLSIYLPSGANEWMMQDMFVYERSCFCDIYQSFLKEYQKYLSKESHVAWHTLTRKEREIKVKLTPDAMEEIASAYLMVLSKDSGQGISYLLSTDSDLKVNRAGYLKAVAEEMYWGIKNVVLCLIETVNTKEYTEYIAPILYRDELCMMHISFSEEERDGEITAIIPSGTQKKQYELQEGDILYPLYPIEQMEKSASTENVYEDSYYIGERVCIDCMADGDAELMQVKVNLENCHFGFIIQDTKQQFFYISEDSAENGSIDANNIKR